MSRLSRVVSVFIGLQVSVTVSMPAELWADGSLVEAPPTSFQECIDQGGRVEKSQPTVCIFKESQRFIRETGAQRKACADRCGDGVCQEIVCMAVGCPCSENAQSCPKDCKD